MTAIEEIATERRRQIEGENWSLDHDDKHIDRSLAMAAACAAVLLFLAQPATAGHSKLSPAQQVDIANTVRTLGYACSLAKDLHHLAWTSRGQQVKITCGPPGRDEIRRAYRVTIHPNQTVSIDPCHILWCRANYK